MVKLVKDVRLIRIVRWRSTVQNLLIIGSIFLAAALYRLSEDNWAFSSLTAIYLPVGMILVASGIWHLMRGPIIYVEKGGVTENDI